MIFYIHIKAQYNFKWLEKQTKSEQYNYNYTPKIPTLQSNPIISFFIGPKIYNSSP